MSSTDAEDPTLISNDCTTELWNVERVCERDLVRSHLVDIEEVHRFTSPLEVVNVLVRGVALLQDEGVVQ